MEEWVNTSETKLTGILPPFLKSQSFSQWKDFQQFITIALNPQFSFTLHRKYFPMSLNIPLEDYFHRPMLFFLTYVP